MKIKLLMFLSLWLSHCKIYYCISTTSFTIPLQIKENHFYGSRFAFQEDYNKEKKKFLEFVLSIFFEWN